MKGYILDASNLLLKVANWISSAVNNPTSTVVDGFPFGDTVGDGTGTVGMKVLLIGTAAGSPSGVKVTPNFASLANSSQVIPIGAKGWTAIILTGTGSIGGAAVPAGVTLGDNNTLLATVTVTANAGSTAVVYWNT